MKIHFPNSVAEINLTAIAKNIQSIKERSGDKKILAVVKCDAYSHNAVKVSSHIEEQVDWLAVACVDEGIELRMGGIKKPILVLGVPTYQNAAAYQTHN
ncbi:MAG: alanine racemase, partial [Balneolaceae bacterium]|nr:alanine racemase [Balneolaceae bacterium]